MNEESVIQEFEELYADITLLEFNGIEDTFKEEFNKVKNPIIKRRWKKLVFNFKMADYKKEKIWEYINNDLSKEKFDYFVSAVHKGWFK